MKEKSLSEEKYIFKARATVIFEKEEILLHIEDVREAVLRLKESLKEQIDYSAENYVNERIDEIFGEELSQ